MSRRELVLWLVVAVGLGMIALNDSNVVGIPYLLVLATRAGFLVLSVSITGLALDLAARR